MVYMLFEVQYGVSTGVRIMLNASFMEPFWEI